MITTEGLLEAYYVCRKNKRKTANAIMYELNYENNLIKLKDRINKMEYQPGKSICFVVTRPRYREVFAATFEDRIIHHWIALRLEPLFEEVFSPRTFNCRKDKGQTYGVRMLYNDIKECSENYTKDCYVAKLDLQGFFMSINKEMLYNMLDKFIVDKYKGEDVETLRYLCKTVILHKPECNCERRSSIELWNNLPPNKSLFTNGEGLGIAIGNLFAQLFANFLLNVLDWYLIKDLGFKYVGRYVDDFYILDNDKSKILSSIPKIRKLLDGMGLRLHPKKFYIQHYTKGVEFTGCVIKKDRIYTSNRNVNNFILSVKKLNKAKDINEVRNAVNSVNSYLGLLRNATEYATRRRILKDIEPRIFRYIYIKGHHEILALKKRYRKRENTFYKIENGEY